MGKRKQTVANLLNRIQFIDLAGAIFVPRSSRKSMLRQYVERSLKGGNFSSYKPFRNAIPTIYGVQRGLDPSPRVEWCDLESALISACKGKDVDMNVEAAEALYKLTANNNYSAFDHPIRDLSLGLGKKAAIGIETYLVKDGAELIFQYAYPRRTRLEQPIINLMLSLVCHSYARDDFESAYIELADLSCDGPTIIKEIDGTRRPAPRDPRILRLDNSDLINMADLSPEIQNVHELLLEIGNEPD